MTVTFDDARLSEAQVVERIGNRRAGQALSRRSGVKPETVRQWLAYWTTGERLEVAYETSPRESSRAS